MKTFRLAISGALLVFSSLHLFAASLNWDPTESAGTALGGSGNWDQVSSNWFNGTVDLTWTNANNDDAIFSGTASTVTLTENISAGNLYFTNATGNYLITNATGAEVLTVAGAIDTGGGDHTIGVPISNSSALNKNGAGRLHLPADNSATFTGNLVINQGDVSVENNNGAGPNSSITVADGAALVLNGGAAGLTVFPQVTINGSGITNSGAIRNLSGVTTFNGQIILGASNNVIYSDSGSAFVYGGANGPLTDNGSNYNLTISASGTGNFHMGKMNIGGTLNIQGPASCYNVNLAGVSPTSWKNMYIFKGGTVYVDNTNSFGTPPATLMTTNVLLDGGTINSSGTYTMYGTDGITVTTNGGTLTVASGTLTTCNIYSQSNASVTLGGAGSSRPGGAAGTTTGTINLGTGALIKSGSGDCNLGYANPSLEIYSNLVLNGGSVSFNYDVTTGQTTSLGAVPSTLNSSNIVLNGGQLHVGHSTTIAATRGIYVTSAGGTIEDVTSGGTVTIASPISGPGSMNFPLGKSGSTTAVILTANNSYAGTTTVGASCTVTVGSGGTTGTLGTGNTSDNGTLIINRTGSYSYGGVISGTGAVIKNAAGTLTLTGANTYSGNTTNNTGTLLINNTSKSGTGTGSVYVNSGILGGNGFISGAVTINSGAKLAPGPTASSVGTLTISNNLTIAGNVTIAINKSLSPSNSAVVVTGTLANSGSGTLAVTNLGAALAVGDRFQIFSQPLTGNAMAVSGGGVTWSNNLAVDGSISVATVPTPIPAIVSFSFSAGNLVLAGTNGYPSNGFSVLTSTNLADPLTNWTTFTTGSYDASGNFAITNSITNTAPAQFFIIKSH